VRWARNGSLALAVLLSLAARRGDALNSPTCIRPKHLTRGLVTGGIVFLDSWKPLSPQVSGIFQVSLVSTEVSPCGQGPQSIAAPTVYLHVGLVAGYRLFESDDRAYGVGQLGFMWRTAGSTGLSWISAAGVVGAVAWPPRQIGPLLLRFEIIDNIGVYGGPLIGWNNTNNAGVLIGVDYMFGLWRDVL
jgi:hypothetical protein